jgi:PHYB activation tagged suppressor 1
VKKGLTLVVHSGRTFLYWIGPIPAIFSIDLELIKEVLTDRTGLFAKDFMIPILKVLLGNGLILANGDDWRRHRKVVLPAFNHERIKVVAKINYYAHMHLCTYYSYTVSTSLTNRFSS